MSDRKRGKGAGKAPARPSSRKAGARGLAAGRAPAGEKAPPARRPAGEGARKSRKARPRGEGGAPDRSRARGLAARPQSEEPDPDGYFVARVRGEQEVRDAPHPMTEAALEAARGAPRERPPARLLYEERLGELPWSYGDDALVALARDPRTLFLYWDLAAETARRGWEGLERGRAEIWVFAEPPGGGRERVRVVPFALEARSWYVHDLDPGRTYRAEIHLVDDRRDRMLAGASNAVQLPPQGPSPLVDDRFARLVWGEPLDRLRHGAASRTGAEATRRELLARSGFAGGSSPSSPWGGGR